METQTGSAIARILRTAESLFLSKNYAEVTMEQIAEAGSVTKGAIYHYFSSKEALYLALFRNDLSEKTRLFSAAIESGESSLERLRNLTRAFFDLPGNKQEITKLVRRDINIFAEPDRGELVRSYQRSLPELAELVIRDGIRDGELAAGDPRLLSWHFVATVEVTLCRYVDRLFDDLDAKLDHVLNLFFQGAAAKVKDREEVEN